MEKASFYRKYRGRTREKITFFPVSACFRGLKKTIREVAKTYFVDYN